MSRIFHNIIFVVLLLLVPSCSPASHLSQIKKDVSPYDFGLATAKTGKERYQVLLDTHRAAIAAGVNVDYSGIDTIKIEIPTNPSIIPLTQYNDFKDCVFVVKNTSKNCWLFGKEVNGISVSVTKKMIDAGDFRSHNVLGNGRFILVVEDVNPWVSNRKGYDYGHQRKDILLIENGVAKNSVVMPYDNEYSKPQCYYIKLGEEPFVFKNITLERDYDCTFLTHVVIIDGLDDIRISGFRLITPENNMSGDRGIRIFNSTNVSLSNINIEGTYSQHNSFGYGINLGNVWNFKADNLYGNANWGIFGNNNINTVSIENSHINRFDIHCYGRDITFKNVCFSELYNQYSSVFGVIRYDKCTFTDFVPVLNDGSYNSFVDHLLVMNDCVFNITSKKNYIFKIWHFNESSNARHELAEKCLPNVKIKNMVVNMTDGADRFYLFFCASSGDVVSSVGRVKNISIDGLTINPEKDKLIKEIVLSNITINTKEPIDCKLTNVKVNQPTETTKAVRNNKPVKLVTNMTIKEGKVIMKNVKGVE